MACDSNTAESGASDDGFSTTELPATSAAPTGPPMSANGKLNGLITAHTPYGLRTVVVSTFASPRFPMVWTYPLLRSTSLA